VNTQWIVVLLLCVFLSACALEAGAASAADGSKSVQEVGNILILSAPLTHSDWMGKAGKVEGVVWGPEGVHHMLDACKASGWSIIHWRCLDGGRALYKSKFLVPQSYPQGQPESAYWTPLNPAVPNYNQFDSLKEAVSYGHKIGLKIYAWISINEDDHGGGIPSRFTRDHPESRWRKRDGTFYGTQQSFAFPNVRQYKLRIIQEIIDNYEVDGVFMDWIRTGDDKFVKQTDDDGVADYGYEEPLVTAFKKQYGIDPLTIPNSDERWVQFRSQPITTFMRQARRMMRARRPGIPLIVMGYHPWAYRGNQIKIDGNLRGGLLDMTTWARERLIDGAIAAGYYLPGGDMQKAYKFLRGELDGKARTWMYAWVPSSAEEFNKDADAAISMGCRSILFWEADYIDNYANKAEIQAAMRAYAVMPKAK